MKKNMNMMDKKQNNMMEEGIDMMNNTVNAGHGNAGNGCRRIKAGGGRWLAVMAAAAFMISAAGCSASSAQAADKTLGTSAETTVGTAPSAENGTDAADLTAPAAQPEANASQSAETQEVGPGVTQSEVTNGVIETQASYVKDSPFSGDGKLVFKNDTLGTFIVIISDMTQAPETLEDGKTYVISHAEMMTMSEPGQLPQVYAVRETDSEYHDSVGTVTSVDENGVMFEQQDGSQFAVSSESLKALGVDGLQKGMMCVVTHTDAMTRSIPGIYMDVSRVYVMGQADSAA